MGVSVFRSAFVAKDLIAADTACTGGQYTKLGQYIVLAGEKISVGYGSQSGQENAVGRIFIDLKTSAPAAIPGIVRISVMSPQNMPIAVLDEFRTEALSASTDRTKQIPYPDHMIDVNKDFKLVLEFNPDTTATVSKANCTIQMDITRTLTY